MAECLSRGSCAIVGHSGSGKTALTDAILYKAGAVNRLGSPDAGTSVSDYRQEEIDREISITSSILNYKFKNERYFLIDVPGYSDFIGEAIAAMRVADLAVIVVDATGGVQIGTDRAWGLATEQKIPKLVVVSKLDKDNTSYKEIITQLRERFGKASHPLCWPKNSGENFKEVAWLLDEQVPDGAASFKQDFMDSVTELDDALLERYLGGETLKKEDFLPVIKKGIAEGQIIPVFPSSVHSGESVGIQEILEGINMYMPLPTERKIFLKKDEEKELVPIKADPNGNLAAFVFKTVSDPYVGQLSVFRVFAGKLSSDTELFNTTRAIKERFGQIYFLEGKQQEPVQTVSCGDIAAVAKLKQTKTGDTFYSGSDNLQFEQLDLPESAVSVSVKPHSKQDEEKIMAALSRLSQEDPTFCFSRDQQTSELLVSGQGDLHLEIEMAKLKDNFKVGVDIGQPKVPYKETIAGTTKAQGKYKKQSGGRGQYGDCWIEIEPLPRGTGFEFVDKIVGGAIPRQYILSVEKGIKDSMKQGILAGYPVVDIKVTLYDGSFHSVDSSDMAFQIAGSMAFKKAQEAANPVMLEPIMEVEVVIPADQTGQITGDINGKRGRIMGIDSRGKTDVVKALIPLSEMFSYASGLKSMTGGRGSYTMRFNSYQEIPFKLTERIVQEAKKAREESKV